MGKYLFSARFSCLFVLLSQAVWPGEASAIETPAPAHTAPPHADMWSGVPASFTLSGEVVDDEGHRVRGVKIFERSGETKRLLTTTDNNGRFSIAEPLTATTRLVAEHAMFAPGRFQAGMLYPGDGRKASLEITPYTERFDVTPEGGTYSSGQLTLEVPPGAVTQPVTILAAQLPLDISYNRDGMPEPTRLTAVDLKPHGLKFLKPVTLTMTIDREDIGNITSPVSFSFDETLGRYIHDAKALVKIEGQRVSLTINHFSSHVTADGHFAQSTTYLGRGTDIDGDERASVADAVFMLVASGGGQMANATLRQTLPGVVMKISETPQPGDKAFGFKGQTFTVVRPEVNARALGIAERFSLSRGWRHDFRNSVTVTAGQAGFDCKMVVGTFDFFLVQGWHGAPLQDGASFIIAKPRSAAPVPCPGTVEARLHQSSVAAVSGARGRKAKQASLSQNFYFGNTASASDLATNSATNRAGAWGTFDRDTIHSRINMGCFSKQHEVWNYTIDAADNLPDNEAGVHIWSTASTPRVTQGARPETSIAWTITNASPDSFGEHLTAGLFKQTPDGAIPFGFVLHKTAERPCQAVIAASVPGAGIPAPALVTSNADTRTARPSP